MLAYNPLALRRQELETLRTITQAELDAFKQSRDVRKTDEESEIFKALLQVAMHLAVVTDRSVADALAFEVSTVARWRKGDTVPPKKKQIQILEFVLRGVDKVEKDLAKQAKQVGEAMKARGYKLQAVD